ncbi:retrotransposon protein, putative, ty1-copia subclass [Tanacetum coccineum]
MDWYRNLWIVLSVEDKLPYLEQPIPALPVPLAGQVTHPDVIATYQAWVKASKKIAGLMLMTMNLEIQKTLEHLGAYDMLKELKTLYVQQADQELLQTVREFHACKQEEGQSVGSYVLKMKSYIDNLERLGHAMTQNLAQEGSKKNQNKKSHKTIKGNQGKGKAKMGNALVPAPSFAPKPKNPPTPKKDNPAKDAICHQCGEVGHWRRNCPVYLAELMKKKKLSQGASTLGIFTIELYSFPSTSWVYDTGYGTHICITTQGLRASRKLKPGALSLNNLIYFKAIPRDDIYGIDLSSFNTNDSFMYAVSNKRAKRNLDSALLWHCHLGHIIKKHIEKLQHDGLLDSTDIKYFEKCVACMSRKMARKPYSHEVERAKDLLRPIHTDVCGPFKIMSRQGANYFVTFTEDYSGYVYVYLLKHKHEVFETFKVFQKEVENQLGKTIKSLCSDRGGEYMSQNFLDHLKEHGIISHRTPPYTPQHNGVSEKRNRTLLDMDDQEINEPQSDINPIRKSFRTRSAPDQMCLYIDADEHELGDLGEPANYKAALLDLESDKWLNAMNVEMQSMKDNEVWELVDLPPNGKTVGHKWLFKKKTDMDGAVHTYKARLVAKGFTQTPRIDYEETFSPVADIRAIRILIAIAAFYDYEIWQMDVKTAFLNGYLNEEVYMEQPEGFVNQKYPNRVCKLKRSIYGLKQASRQWNKRFDDEIKKFGFSQNRDEPCVYVKASGSYVTFLILYVDDILIMGNNIPMLQDVKSYLGRCFAMKDLGEAAYILGIKIYRDRSKRLIGLCQSAYIEKIMKRFYMENSKRGTIPMQEKLKFSKSQGASTPAEIQRMQNIPYASAVGSIMVSYYTDAGYLTDDDDMKSQTGYVFVLNGGAVDWKSTTQSIFATSSTDTKYIAAFDASKEAV